MKKYATRLRQIIEATTPQIEQLDEADFSSKPSPNKWSKKEILGHLIDSAYNNHQRFLRAESQGDLFFLGYKQEEWVEKNQYQNRPQAEVLLLWKMVNEHLAVVIDSIPEEVMMKETIQHNFDVIGMTLIEEGTPSSLSYLIWDYVFHLEHHMKQILPGYEPILEKDY